MMTMMMMMMMMMMTMTMMMDDDDDDDDSLSKDFVNFVFSDRGERRRKRKLKAENVAPMGKL